MDLQAIILGLAFIAPLVALALYIQKKHQQELAKQTHAFQEVAARHELVLTEQDIWEPGYAIGLDTRNMKLLYTQELGAQHLDKVLDLGSVKNCSVNNISRDVNGGRVIEHLELHFAFHNNTPSSVTLEFYSREKSLNLRDELKLAERWRDIVNAHLKQQPSLAAAEKKRHLLHS
ncbi:MAG: hypothetical protein LPK03_09690 [Pontibacter sp.]|nr:hypothetical protein [Pontibacter sp.]